MRTLLGRCSSLQRLVSVNKESALVVSACTNSSEKDGRITIGINSSTGSSFALVVHLSFTLSSLKTLIALREMIPRWQQIITYESRQLADEQLRTLSSLGFAHSSTLNVKYRDASIPVNISVRCDNGISLSMDVLPPATLATIIELVKDVKSCPFRLHYLGKEDIQMKLLNGEW